MWNPRAAFASLFALLLVVPLGACDDDEDPILPQEAFSLTFAGDASFNGAHGGQPIHVAVVRTDQGAQSVEAEQMGTVSADANPAFSFTFNDVLEEDGAFEVHYWIDSNFMGGTVGVCDAEDDDHQWSLEVGTVSDDVTITDTHRPGETEMVCSTFTDL